MKKIRRLKCIKVVSEISIVLGAILALASGILLFLTSSHFIYLASGFFAGITLIIIGGALFTTLRNTVYTKLIPSYFNGDIDNITFTPFHGISAYQVNMAEHLKDPDSFTSQNLFTGSLHHYPFIISHVTLKQIIDQQSKRTKAYFKGPMVIFDINHSFMMHTHVLSDGKPRMFKNYQSIDLIHGTLHDAFTVYTNEPHKVNHLLTTYMIETINQLHDKHPRLNISFLDKHLIITMNDNVDAFSMNLFKRSHLHRLETLKKDLAILKSLVLATDMYLKS